MRGESIAALLSPDCYPHAVDAIELHETHISWVVLAGEFAYKIKKPVRLPFLDFSKLEDRKFFCNEELRLNRRFAPELYLDVVGIGGTRAAPRIGASPPFEYAVKLRRFRSQDELTSLLARDGITVDELGAFGRAIAHIQSALPIAQPSDILATTADNCRELDQLLGKAPLLVDVTDWLRSQCARIKALSAERARDSFVRDCHGDLHCGNVVRLDRLIAFDCIEFDPRLRSIDVMHDVAFLVMDLSARGRVDLGYAFLNAWLETTGDFAGLALLRFGTVQRAFIRAKVELLRNRDPSTSAVQRYLAYARKRCAAARPRLLLTCGLSGSGKTWVSSRLAIVLPAIHVRSDVERKRLAGLRPLESSQAHSDGGIYTMEFNEMTYDRLYSCAERALTAGESVIVDAAFLRRRERRRFLQLSESLQAPFVILHCAAAQPILRERVALRAATKADASEATLAVLARQQEYFEPLDDHERTHTIDIDTASTFEAHACVHRITAH